MQKHMSLSLTRGALAVLEEIRQDRWAVKPVAGVDGLFLVTVSEKIVQRLQAVAQPNENPSALILRAYREGKFAQPLRVT
jgi:hypothetical protein